MTSTRLAGHTVNQVLGGAYRDSDPRSMLTHYAVEGTETAICGRVKADNLADAFDDDGTVLPTCKSCLAKARKLQKA